MSDSKSDRDNDRDSDSGNDSNNNNNDKNNDKALAASSSKVGVAATCVFITRMQ